MKTFNWKSNDSRGKVKIEIENGEHAVLVEETPRIRSNIKRESSKLKELIERERETLNRRWKNQTTTERVRTGTCGVTRDGISTSRSERTRRRRDRKESRSWKTGCGVEERTCNDSGSSGEKEGRTCRDSKVGGTKIVMSDRQTEEREMALERKIQRLERTRKSLSELVNKEEKEREMSEKLKRADRIVQNYKKLRVKHKVLLELLGEREEELDRLRKR